MSDMESPKEWEVVRAIYLIRIKLSRRDLLEQLAEECLEVAAATAGMGGNLQEEISDVLSVLFVMNIYDAVPAPGSNKLLQSNLLYWKTAGKMAGILANSAAFNALKLIRAEKWTKNRTNEKRQDVLWKLMENLKYMLYQAWLLGCDLEINPEKICRWWDRIKGESNEQDDDTDQRPGCPDGYRGGGGKIAALVAEQYARLIEDNCDALDVTENAMYKLNKQLTALKNKRRDLVRARYEMRVEKREAEK